MRLALGASPGRLIVSVIRRSMRPAIWGIGAGLVLGVLLLRPLSAYLFGVTPLDPLLPGLVLVVLLAPAALAAFLPARRATGTDPLAALRCQ